MIVVYKSIKVLHFCALHMSSIVSWRNTSSNRNCDPDHFLHARNKHATYTWDFLIQNKLLSYCASCFIISCEWLWLNILA